MFTLKYNYFKVYLLQSIFTLKHIYFKVYLLQSIFTLKYIYFKVYLLPYYLVEAFRRQIFVCV